MHHCCDCTNRKIGNYIINCYFNDPKKKEFKNRIEKNFKSKINIQSKQLIKQSEIENEYENC
jgi:hypothetical protein